MAHALGTFWVLRFAVFELAIPRTEKCRKTPKKQDLRVVVVGGG
jgi:hypothetical protein